MSEQHIIENSLLPCPFCGDKPYFWISPDHLSGNGKVVIDCCARMEGYYILPDHKPRKKDTEKQVTGNLVKLWNTRKHIKAAEYLGGAE
jgi:hypothetical protein